MTATVPVAQVLAETGPILLDFDGPVCSIFAGHPAATVAKAMRRRLVGAGVTIPPTIAKVRDPLVVLRWTAEQGNDELTRMIEDALCAAELDAVATARPTRFAREAILTAHEARCPLAIVSNNSAPAILAYLTSHRLTGYIELVVGRSRAEPDKMKPHPEPIRRALHLLDVRPANAVMVGDSPTDVLAAQAAGCRSIGYANRSDKIAALVEAGADAIAHSMAEIARGLTEAMTARI